MAQNTSTKPKKLDARIERSRALIIEAFENLVLKEPFEKLTVSKIAREAQVDRKTFYQHFGSIDGVLRAVGSSAVDNIADEVEEMLSKHEIDPNDKEGLARAFFSAVNESISNNMLLSIALYEAIPNEKLVSDLREFLEADFKKRKLITLDIPDEKLDYYYAFVFGGILNVYGTWMKAGADPYKLDDVADIATELAMNGVSNLVKISADK